jgi:hypothetical protein
MFAPLWKQTNKRTIHRCVRTLVTSIYQLPKEAGDSMTTFLPALQDVRQIWIEAACLLTWFAFGKGSSSQPIADRARTDAHPLGESLLTQALLA